MARASIFALIPSFLCCLTSMQASPSASLPSMAVDAQEDRISRTSAASDAHDLEDSIMNPAYKEQLCMEIERFLNDNTTSREEEDS